MSDQLHVVALSGTELLDIESPLLGHAGVHPEVEGVVNVVRCETILALSFSLDIVTVGVHGVSVVKLIEKGSAAGIVDVVRSHRISDNRIHRPLAGRG